MTRYTIFRYILCITLSVLCCQSCYDDKGNYDYTDINEVYFEGLQEEYTFRTGESVTIKPVLVSTIPGNESDYTYEWVCLKITIGQRVHSDYVWSDLKEWDNFTLGLPGGSYDFYYRVKDNKTGVIWMSEDFNITIVNDISAGFFVLSDVNNVGRVDFVSYYNKEWDLKLDILTSLGTINDMPSLENPIGVNCYYDYNSPKMGSTTADGRYGVAVLTKQGGYRLKPTNFTYDKSYDLKENVTGILSSDFYVKDIYVSRPSTDPTLLMLDNNNDLYYYMRTWSLFWTVGGNCNRLSDGSRVSLSPQIASMMGGAVMYDSVNKRFLNFGTYASYLSDYAESHEKIFKYNKTGQDLIFMHGRSSQSGENNAVTALLKNASNEYYLVGFLFDGTQKYSAKVNLTDLANAKEFAMSYNGSRKNLYNEFLYYRTDTKIYLYNIADGENIVVYSAPTGSKISKMGFSDSGDFEDHLMVFTYDESKPADSCGKLEVMVAKQTYGTLSVAEDSNGNKLVWTGFGKVVDAEWKYR